MDWSLLPEGCISHVLSLTSPRDACVLATVSSIFRSAADSNIVWERFLPADYEDILTRAVSPVEFLSRKDLYFRLCRPILIDGGRKSFVLEKSTGKKCFMLSARELLIALGDDSRYWAWISHPVSRFEEVAKLLQVCWFDIIGRIRTVQLSPDTTYVAYLVFKLTENSYGFDRPEQNASITTRDQHSTKIVCLLRREATSMPGTHRNRGILNFRTWNRNQVQTPPTRTEETDPFPYVRADGWLEVVMGEFFNEVAGNEEEVTVRLLEVEHLNWKSGLFVEGIELRPKNYTINHGFVFVPLAAVTTTYSENSKSYLSSAYISVV